MAPRRSFTQRMQASKKRLGLEQGISSTVGEREEVPTVFWLLDKTIAWKRERGYGSPSEKILEPGYAGDIDREELEFIWERIKASPKLARDWGFKTKALGRSNVPVSHIQAVAMYGLEESK